MEDTGHLTLLAWDNGPGVPMQHTASEDDLDGRGLSIIEALSSQWGYYYAQDGGKVVWAEFVIPSGERSSIPLQRRLVATHIHGPRSVASLGDLDLLGRVRKALLKL